MFRLLDILFVPVTWRYFKSVKANGVGCLGPVGANKLYIRLLFISRFPVIFLVPSNFKRSLVSTELELSSTVHIFL